MTLVFLVVTQLGGGRRSRGGDNMAPAGLKIQRFERGGKKLTITTTTSWSLFTMPGICPAATGNECSISHAAQLTPFNTTGGVYKTLPPFLFV